MEVLSCKTCCIFNIAPSYRAAIYLSMAEELPCDFFLGDQIESHIKKMDYSILPTFKKELKNKWIFGGFYWQVGAVATVFKPYKNYILTGNPYCLSNWIILIVAKILRKNTFLWTHGWYGDENNSKRFIKRLYVNFSTRVLLYGNYAKELMIKEGIDKNKLVTIYNSLDYNSQVEIMSKLSKSAIFEKKFNNSNPVLLFIGRLQKSKNIVLLIEALSVLSLDEESRCNLILIGKETDKLNLKELVAVLGLEKSVWFYGESYDENLLAELIYNSSISVTPGNVGLTVMHSFVYGVPVITHNNFKIQGPEFEAIIPGLTGDYYKFGDLIDLIKVIKKWIIKIKYDRDAIRHNCQKVIDDKYNPQSQLKILKQLIN